MSAEPLPPRVAALVARFETIGREVMRELPIYNPALEVEAIGFRAFDVPAADGDAAGAGGGSWLGVLITPWFMNAILLPEQPRPIDWSRVGRSVEVALPAGPRAMMIGAEEAIGAYLMLSLHSPMDQFKHQPQARSEAIRQILALTTPPDEPAAIEHLPPEPSPVEVPPVEAPPAETKVASRRSFLAGGRPA